MLGSLSLSIHCSIFIGLAHYFRIIFSNCGLPNHHSFYSVWRRPLSSRLIDNLSLDGVRTPLLTRSVIEDRKTSENPEESWIQFGGIMDYVRLRSIFCDSNEFPRGFQCEFQWYSSTSLALKIIYWFSEKKFYIFYFHNRLIWLLLQVTLSRRHVEQNSVL